MIERESLYHNFDFYAANLQCGKKNMVPSILTSSPLFVEAKEANETTPDTLSPRVVALLVGIILILTVTAAVTSAYIFIGKQAIKFH